MIVRVRTCGKGCMQTDTIKVDTPENTEIEVTTAPHEHVVVLELSQSAFQEILQNSPLVTQSVAYEFLHKWKKSRASIFRCASDPGQEVTIERMMAIRRWEVLTLHLQKKYVKKLAGGNMSGWDLISMANQVKLLLSQDFFAFTIYHTISLLTKQYSCTTSLAPTYVLADVWDVSK